MSLLTILTLRLPADRRDEVIRYYETGRVLGESGAVSATLGVPLDDPHTVVVLAEWHGPSAYQAWLASPRREEFSRGILAAADDSVTATSETLEILAAT